jgi:tRNA pseudouridine32 synthase/23S rRNA pseudouridine746 synthase
MQRLTLLFSNHNLKGMNLILPEGKAKKICMDMMKAFDDTGFIDYDGDRTVRSDSLKQEGHGKVFGVLVTYEGTVLKAFSGALDGRYVIKPFEEPVFDPQRMSEMLSSSEKEVQALTEEIQKTGDKQLEKRRREISSECWTAIKREYRFTCFDGQVRTLDEIAPTAQSGTGDCCAPKLLSAAYSKGLRPAYMAEFLYGSGAHESGEFLTPCDQRCKPILKDIIGLDIIYQDKDIVVINKPSGLLSIPGKGPEKFDSAATRVRRFFHHVIAQPCIHRLDQATSGLMVLGLTDEAHDKLSMDFENRKIHKEYEALVQGIITEESGTIDLPIRLDTECRPRQIVDLVHGKQAITDWIKIRVEPFEGGHCTRLRLIPRTGRTHQLRVHCAEGLGHSIIGDPLYGSSGDRMMLEACVLEFTHPITGEEMRFELPVEF